MKTLLEAVNSMLRTINEQPLDDDVDLANSLEGQTAQTVLDEQKRSILARGWDANMDDNWEMTPDSNGEIAIPGNVLEITSVDGTCIMRDWRLYDKVNKTFKFTGPVLCNVKWDMDFADLTYALAFYIAKTAAREFQMEVIGDIQIDAKLQQEQARAYIAAVNNDGFTEQPNMLNESMGLLIR